MRAEARILKNTVVMILQPLFLNLISLFVIGYIARKLGVDDFGTFNLAILFTTLFYPLGVVGLNSVSIRDISKLRDSREQVGAYVGKLLSLRLLLFVSAVLLILVAATLMRYPQRVTQAIYLAAAIVGVQLFSEALCDIFTALERMEYTALIALISGLTLTILSVIVLYCGYGLFAVLAVYVIGQICGSIAALAILRRQFLRIRFRVDLAFWREKLVESLPFVTMSLTWAGMMRFDTIVLSKVVGSWELGLYTAGMLLVTKIDLIPAAVGYSIYPAASNLHATGRNGDIPGITRQALSFMTAVSLPICIGTALYGGQIIRLVFGPLYQNAGWILSIAIWVLLLRCFMYTEFSILAAIHKQKSALHAYLVAGGVCLVLNLGLTYWLKTEGALIAFMGSQVVLLIFFTLSIMKEMPGCLRFVKGQKILYLNLALILLLILLRSMDFVVVLILSGSFYLLGVFALEIVTMGQIKALRHA